MNKIGCALLISLFCWLTSTAQRARTINIKDFGAVANDGKDDQNAFQKLINFLEKESTDYIVQIPAGSYILARPVYTNKGLKGNITFRGEKGTKILMRGHGGGAFVAASAEATLLLPLKRNDSLVSLRMKGAFQPAPGDLIHLQSDTPFETAWKYKENDTHRILSVKGNLITFSGKSLFNFDPSNEKVTVTIYKRCSLNFSNIEYVLDPAYDPRDKIVETMLGVKGMSIDMKNVSFRYTGNDKYYHVGLSAVACESLSFRNITLDNLQYGVLMNYCRNITAFDTWATYCRHAYTPTQACYDVYVENLNGANCQSVMDAHVSFLVHYKHINDSLATQLPNCRSLGTTIEDAKIVMSGNYNQLYCYWSVQTLAPEYKAIYGEYDTKFKNVNWVSKNPGSFNGLTSYSCRRFIVENCTTHSIAYYGDQTLEKVEIRNSRVGCIRIDGNKALVENTVMDGKLTPVTSFVFRFLGKGECRLDNVTVRNYNPQQTYLFDYEYNAPAFGNNLIITNSNIGPLKGWVRALAYPGKPVNYVQVKSSMISDFKEKIPPEYSSLTQEINAARATYRKQ